MRYLALVLLTACHCGAGVVQPVPVPPAPVGSVCYQACQLCEPDAVEACAAACARDQAQGVATQLDPAQVLATGKCP